MNRSISYKRALSLVTEAAKVLSPVEMSLADAVGHITAKEIISTEMSPNGDLAAMDGYAVRALDTISEKPNTLVNLRVIGVAEAGKPAPMNITHSIKSAVRISTGALVPSGFDSVIPLEKVIVNGASIKVPMNLSKGQNIRKIGEDHRLGDVVLEVNRKIEQQHVLLLANVGCDVVNVIRKPKVLVISTGTEIKTNHTESLQTGNIYNSNYQYLVSAIRQMGCEQLEPLIIADNKTLLQRAFENALSVEPPVDLIITTGGISKGNADFVPHIISRIGGNFLFRGVELRPGKPVLAANFCNRATLHFGLPGNPLAVLATFQALVIPYLRVLQGRSIPIPEMKILGRELRQDPNHTKFLLAKLDLRNTENSSTVLPLSHQKASLVAGLRFANSLVLIPPGNKLLRLGSQVSTFRLGTL